VPKQEPRQFCHLFHSGTYSPTDPTLRRFDESPSFANSETLERAAIEQQILITKHID
jgi:hypothetical protein